MSVTFQEFLDIVQSLPEYQQEDLIRYYSAEIN